MNKERLLKLADHLEHGTLIHKRFDFGSLNTNHDIDGRSVWQSTTKENPCGSNGCAIGETPAVFPEYWEFRQPPWIRYKTVQQAPDFTPLLISNSTDKPFNDASLFFNISNEEADLLFMPSVYADQEDREQAKRKDTYDGEEDFLIINNEETYRQFVNATKEEVAKHIRKFVELKEKELNVTI